MPAAVKRMMDTLRFAALRPEVAPTSDRGLLEAFAEHADESAFAELVHRHGPLVLGVCRRMLGNVQDAEDAFQATFLVLARKAGSIAWQESVKSWLHNVAYRISLKARARLLRRRDKERTAHDAMNQQADPSSVGRSEHAAACEELRTVLDDELHRLPTKYSAPLLLCYLEGKTRDEAAEELGWSVGSLKGRLERGRELLRGRLAKRGITLSAALVTGLLGAASAGATPVSAGLSIATVQSSICFMAGASAHSAIAGSVLTLAQGALHTMMIAKLKWTGMISMFVLSVLSAAWGVHLAGGERADASPPAVPVVFAQERKAEPGAKKDGERNRTNDILGVVKELDLKVGSITIAHLRENMPGDGTYSLADKNIKVTSSFGLPLAPKDLQVGQRVHLELKKDADVSAIVIEHPQFFGALGHIDPVRRVVELRGERKISIVTVDDKAKITVAGRAAKLADVPLNERSHITMSFDRKTILEIRVVRAGGDRPAPPRREGDRPGAERAPERVPGNVGTIIDLDPVKGTLNLLSGRADDPSILRWGVAKDLKVKVMFDEKVVQEIAFAQLTKPLQATVQLSEDKSTVTAISVRVPIVRGIIQSVDAAGSKITLSMEERKETSFALAPGVVVRKQGVESKLGDLKAGDFALIGLSLDRQSVIAISSQERRRDER